MAVSTVATSMSLLNSMGLKNVRDFQEWLIFGDEAKKFPRQRKSGNTQNESKF